MVDKKTPTKKPNVKKAIKETKEQAFNRIAKVRVEKVLKGIRILGNCSNRANYSYTQEQVDKISEKLYESLANMLGKFVQSKKEQESFDF